MFFVVRKAFGAYSWCEDVSPRHPKTTLSFSTFLEKVDIGNADIGLRRGTFNYEQLIRSLCARTKNEKNRRKHS